MSAYQTAINIANEHGMTIEPMLINALMMAYFDGQYDLINERANK